MKKKILDDNTIAQFFYNLYRKSRHAALIVNINLDVLYVTPQLVQALGFGTSLPLNIARNIGRKNSFYIKECIIEQSICIFNCKEENEDFKVTATPFTIEGNTFAALTYEKIEQKTVEPEQENLVNNLRRNIDVINNFASLISSAGQLMEVKPDDEKSQLADLIVKYSKQIKRATSHFDFISEINKSSGYKIFVNMPMFINILFEKIQTILSTNSQTSNITLNYSCRCKAFFSQINVKSVEAAIGNIISNAARFTYVNPVIDVEAYEKNNMFCIKISDNGMAIDKDSMDRIFEQGYSTYSNNGAVGQGLGLCIAQVVAYDHNGNITVESDGKQGTQVTLMLPRAKGQCDILFKEDFFREDSDDSFSNINIELSDI